MAFSDSFKRYPHLIYLTCQGQIQYARVGSNDWSQYGPLNNIVYEDNYLDGRCRSQSYSSKNGKLVTLIYQVN